MKRFFLIILLAGTGNFVQSQELWGVTTYGGEFGGGIIFKTDADGNSFTVQKSLYVYGGRSPQFGTVCEGSGGKLYGVTSQGGRNGKGVLFEYDTLTDTYTIKVNFDNTTGGEPYSSLIVSSSGKLYGVTTKGGANNVGVLFEYDPTNDLYTVKHDFDKPTGSSPYSKLLMGSDNRLYGTTSVGGVNNRGVLFAFDLITGSYTSLFDFDGLNGSYPYGSVVETTSGIFYGMTSSGGLNNRGVLFEYDLSTDSLTKKVDFNRTNGNIPYGDLFMADNNKLYGLTTGGGQNSKGVLFEYDIASSQLTVKFDFDGTKGAQPYGSLTKGVGDKLYGMTSYGGTSDLGVIFEYTISTDTLIKKIDLVKEKGGHPFGSLFKASNGKFYGLPRWGGAANTGTFFEYSLSENTIQKLIEFFKAPDGKEPSGPLFLASNSKLYGTTSSGGDFNAGVLYEIDVFSNLFTKKHDFEGTVTSGSGPIGGLTEDGKKKLYGVTIRGGTNNKGTLFSYTYSTNTFENLVDFDGINGNAPVGGLLFVAAENKLYGTTTYGGANDLGVLFEYDLTTRTFSKLIDFSSSAGTYPRGKLLYASDSNIYGITNKGGANNAGVLYQFSPNTGDYKVLVDFDVTTKGFRPYSGVTEIADGILYGMVREGGPLNFGLIYEYDFVNDIFTDKFDFNGTNQGKSPYGSPLFAANGKLYGVTYYGGNSDYGILFEYNPEADQFVKKVDFDGVNGSRPQYGITEVIPCYASQGTTVVESCDSYTVPSGDETYVVPGNYTVMDTLINACGNDSILSIDLTLRIANRAVDLEADSTLVANAVGAIYQWIDCNDNNSEIPGANQQSFTPTTSGSYAVIINEDGCVAISECIEITLVIEPDDPIVLGMDDNRVFADVTVYPNPNSGILHIEFGSLKDISLKVTNVNGQTIYSQDGINESMYELVINEDPGIYYLDIRSGNSTQQYKLVLY